MKPERWQQVDQLFQAALERAPEQRAAFVNEACAGDDSLRREVEALLAADGAAKNLLEAPAYAVAAPLLAEDDGQSLLGQTIGHYQIIVLLGKGGMGAVYRARDARLGRNVALKVLPKTFAQDAERLRRFEREARAASALNHPNIITIHEIGAAQTEIGETHYIVTELVEGETLRQRLAAGKIGLSAALEVTTQVAGALATAHEAGIVHRDIKPENVMVRPDGLVKVLDFGLAKLAKLPASADLSSASRASQSSTDAGVVLGTVRYMSPEQARGLKADARADVWSLGVVLYEIVAGKAPFEGVNTFEVVAAILEREPLPLRQHNADVPDEIQRIVSKALQKDREERYQTANDLLLDLKSLKEELALRAKLARSTRKEIDGRQRSVAASGERVVQVGESDKTRATSNAKQLISGIKQPNRGVALGLAALILIGAGTVFVLYRLISQRQARPGANNQPVAPLQTMQIRRLTNTGNITTAAISPDGKYVAYAVRDGGQQSLWLRQVEITSNVQITPSTEDDVAGLTFSHNGNY